MSDDSVNPETGTDPANPQSAEAGLMTDEQAVQQVLGLLEPEGPTDEPKPKTPPVNQEEPKAEPSEAQAEEEPSESEESSDTDPEDSEAIELPSSINELAQALEIDVAEVAKMKVPVKIDGETAEVTLSEAIEGYQKDRDYRSKTADLAEQRRTFEAERQGKQSEMQEQWQQMTNLAAVLQQRLGGYSTEQLDQILQEQGAEAYLAAKQKTDADKEALAQVQQQQQAMMQKAMEEQSQFRNRQQALLKEKAPEFGDPEKLPAIERGMSAYLKTKGFSDEDIGGFFNGPFDHKQVLIIRDAMRFADMKGEKAKAITKKVKAKPQMVKPGKSQDHREKPDANVTALRDRLRKSRTRGKQAGDEAAFAYVRELLE